LSFKTTHFSEVEAKDAEETGAERVKVRWLITKEDGANNFAMRYFEISPNGHSPHHSHGWEHEVFILNGKCQVTCGNEKKNVGAGYAVFIPPNMLHQFKNVGKTTLKFLCLVPHHK